jgi:hypothetical protein
MDQSQHAHPTIHMLHPTPETPRATTPTPIIAATQTIEVYTYSHTARCTSLHSTQLHNTSTPAHQLPKSIIGCGWCDTVQEQAMHTFSKPSN